MAKKPPRNGLVPYAKIGEDAVRRIVQGFSCAEPIADIARATRVSAKTCRSIVLALRYRLARVPFRIWRNPAERLWGFEGEVVPIADAAVFSVFARCYFDRHCYSAHQQGRRKSRVCRKCPIRLLEFDEEEHAAALRFIDDIHLLYAALAVGGESNVGKLTLYRARHIHAQVLKSAIGQTRKHGDGSPDFSDKRTGSVRNLYETLIADLKAEPLIRKAPVVPAELEEFEDLTWLDE